mmetsp:Transcript_23052/g.53907  ORF Transcript_23052/g.53907 Transcript_23052/m.53907 type:complete len:242 (+) Transcript_23052:274-999(+)
MGQHQWHAVAGTCPFLSHTHAHTRALSLSLSPPLPAPPSPPAAVAEAAQACCCGRRAVREGSSRGRGADRGSQTSRQQTARLLSSRMAHVSVALCVCPVIEGTGWVARLWQPAAGSWRYVKSKPTATPRWSDATPPLPPEHLPTNDLATGRTFPLTRTKSIRLTGAQAGKVRPEAKVRPGAAADAGTASSQASRNAEEEAVARNSGKSPWSCGSALKSPMRICGAPSCSSAPAHAATSDVC